jgi:GxxExxY protein
VVEGKAIVEIKACRALDESHYAQVLNYLKATGIEVGLLVNFGPEIEYKRCMFTL